jgi:hypothetical protein
LFFNVQELSENNNFVHILINRFFFYLEIKSEKSNKAASVATKQQK